MIGLLAQAAAESPDQTAVVTTERSWTYAELLDRSRRTAAALRELAVERFAIVESDAAHVISLLAGAALAGAEPCQYQPDIAPTELRDHAGELGHDVVVTRRQDVEAAKLLDPDELAAFEGDPAAGTADAQPLMIRTTGTTGRPKAARHDWQVLSRTVESRRPRPDQRWLLAYGPHQFAGIQVLLHVVASRATLVAPFPRQPRDGLAALQEHGVTCVSATPTYWRFLLAEARTRRLALPALEQITLGGEATPGALLEELGAVFPGARISHVYASTEFGSVASVRDGLPGLSVDSLHSESNPAGRLMVRDGQLWVRPTAGMLGYAGPAGATDTEGDDGWRPTGDLVEVVDGRVHFRGRDSEIINVGGVKVHPLPVEERIGGLEQVAAARVHGRANKLTGAIVAVEVVPLGGSDAADLDQLRRDIKAAVSDLPAAWQPRSINFVDAIQTRGDKTVRRMEP